MKVVTYNDTYRNIWDNFVTKTNAPFLFYRNYMDYHSERFTDNSLLIFSEKGRLLALFPASIHGDIIISHGGLTYGGLIYAIELYYHEFEEIMNAICNYYVLNHFSEIEITPPPYIYYSYPTNSLRYYLYHKEAAIKACGLSSSIFLPNALSFSTLRKRKVKKSNALSIEYYLDDPTKLLDFWKLLDQVLYSCHHVHPVHNYEELYLLINRFPKNIILNTAYFNKEIIAGTLLYITKNVVHAQYICANDTGKKICALDALFSRLINKYKKLNYNYFDFGISTEEKGKVLNKGLLFQKEGFGARAVTYETFRFKL